MRSDFGHASFVYKMQGSGNDFILIDNTESRVPQKAMAEWAQKICRRAFGAGADGLIFLDEAPADSEVDYIWHFYNADGSRAEMCGNGSRCAARLAYELELAGRTHVLGTDAGPVRAEVLPETDEAKVQLTAPIDLKTSMTLSAAGRELTVHHVNTGVPHVVQVVDDVDSVDLATIAPALRYHDAFAPAGGNVNFIQVTGPDTIRLRTYERGVEDETYACGTGAAAAVYIANQLGLCAPAATVTTSGGEHLTISQENGNLYLQGQAVLVYKGRLFLRSVGLG